MEGSIGLRSARAALFAALCATLSTTSHVLLSHRPLPLTLVGAVFGAMFAIAFATGRRIRGFWAIAALLVPLELAADTLFTSGQRTCYGPGGGPVTGPLRSFGADLVCGGGHVGPSLANAPQITDPSLPWLLLTAHVAVGLLASWWLRRGEKALQRSLRAAAVLAFRPLSLAVAALRTGVPAAARRVRPPHSAPHHVRPAPQIAHSVVRRGPPLALAA